MAEVTTDACVSSWQVADGRWSFSGSLAEEDDEAAVDHTEQVSSSRWHAIEGRWRYACDGPIQTIDDVANVEASAQESPFRVPTDQVGTPQGPNSTPGEPLCLLRSASPDASSPQDANGSLAFGTEPAGAVQFGQFEEVSDDEIEMLEAVEPMLPGEFWQNTECLPGEDSIPTESERRPSAWKRISSAHAIPNAARQMSAQAHKAKGRVSEKVHRSLDYVKEHTDGKVRVPAKVSETMHRSIGYVKGQTESARKVPAQMSETAQNGFGYAKEKAFKIASGMRRPHAKGTSGGA